MLISLCEHPGKEQHHGAINAREAARRERSRSSIPPCPEEGERNHAGGVLCHHRVQSSVCSIPAPHVCEESDPGRDNPRSYQTLSLAQTTEACLQSCCSEGTCLGVSPCRGTLRQRLQAALPELLRALERHGTILPRILSLLPFSTWGLLPWTAYSGQRRQRGTTGGIVPGPSPGVSLPSSRWSPSGNSRLLFRDTWR